ncbi:MAG: hypothetical protein JXR25_03120 [Pontiellaceae bacterium]|nr:hypothetical protein [Pontiellaceae bacterium]
MTDEEIKAVVTATVVALQNLQSSNQSDMPISNQQMSRSVTIPANSEVSVPFKGSYIAILSNNTTRDVMVSADDGLESPVRAGSGYPCVRLNNSKTSYEPAVYSRVTFKNPLDSEMTIEYMLSLGEAKLPMVINDTVRVESNGVPVGRDAVLATVAGTPVVISANAKAVEIQPVGGGVLVCDADGKQIFQVGDLDDVIRPYSNCTLIIKGDGADVTTHVSEVQ